MQTGPSSKRAKNVDISSQPITSGLFDAVKSGKAALRSVINQWISDYKQRPSEAMLEMIQFFVDSCGCKSMSYIILILCTLLYCVIDKITMEMFEQLEYSNIIDQLTKHFAEDAGDYPLVINTATYRRFKVIAIIYNIMPLCNLYL